MSGVLFIGEAERLAISQAVLTARARPVPWSVLKGVAINDRDAPTERLMLGERQNPERIAELRAQYPAQRLLLGSYTVAISFEEQPAGLMRHLSISSRDPGKVPNEHVVAMVVKAFGFSGWPLHGSAYRFWFEEFEPGHMAINFVELVGA